MGVPALVGGQKSEAIQEGLRAYDGTCLLPGFLSYDASVCVVGTGYVGVMYGKRTIGVLEADLVAVEAKITRLRSEQHVLVRELEYGQAPQSDGSRSMVDYVQSRLDIKRDTARDLVFAARRFVKHRGLHDRMLNRDATFDTPTTITTLTTMCLDLTASTMSLFQSGAGTSFS
jgi:hypothetical protein